MTRPNLQQAPAPNKATVTDVLRVRTKFIIDPIVTLLARLHFSPDLLTVMGMAFHFIVAWLIAVGQMRWAAVALLFIAPMDALDGALARKLNRDSGGFGAFLDSSLDRVAEIILFGGFVVFYGQAGNVLLQMMAYTAVTGSLMVSYARARAEGLGFSCKVGLLSRVERYGLLTVLLFLNLPHVALIILAVFTYITALQRLLHVQKQAKRLVDDAS